MRSFPIEGIIQRNKAIAGAGESILLARKKLDRLEEILSGTVCGDAADVREVIECGRVLRDAVNRIVVGLVESSYAPAVSGSIFKEFTSRTGGKA